MAEEGLDVELLRSRGLTCSRLKAMESKERRDKDNAFKDASKFRSAGFNQGADMQEKVGKAQEDLANKLQALRKKVCGLK